jgi:hypothetical protein
MIHFNILGQHIIVLNSLEVITDLLERRSSNYSDRKQTTMMIELCVPSYSFLLKELVKNAARCRMDLGISMSRMPYGLWWRKHRKTFHEYFQRNAVNKYQPIQRQETRAFLRRLLITPDNFFHHIRQ